MYFSLSEDPETIMETIREDSRFEDLLTKRRLSALVVRERLKQFRVRTNLARILPHLLLRKMGSVRIPRDALPTRKWGVICRDVSLLLENGGG